MPDMARLRLEKKDEHQHQPFEQARLRLTETQEDTVFSTAETSMQGTGRDARHNLAMESQSSLGVHEEQKNTGRRDN